MQKNRIEVAGYVAAKPGPVRYLPSGTPVANVRLGESYTFKGSDGKPQKHTNWHSLSLYGELATFATTLDKGDNIFVEGSIEQRQFTPKKDGVQRTVHEIVVRACHTITSRGSAAKAAADNGSSLNEEEPPMSEQEAEDVNHDRWPVG